MPRSRVLVVLVMVMTLTLLAVPVRSIGAQEATPETTPAPASRRPSRSTAAASA